MNFLNRKMFQAGGTVTYSDGSTSQFDTATFESKIKNLPDAELFALRRNELGGNLKLSPELSAILKKESDFRSIGPQIKRETSPTSIPGIVSDVPEVMKQTFLPIFSGLTRSLVPERRLEQMPFLDKLADYDSPMYGEGLGTAIDVAFSGGRTQEDIKNILTNAASTDVPSESSGLNDMDFINEDMASKIGARDFELQQRQQRIKEALELQEKMIQKYSPEDQKFLRDNIDPNTGFLTITPDEVMMRPVKTDPSFIGDPADIRINIGDVSKDLDELVQERKDMEAGFEDIDKVPRPTLPGLPPENLDSINNLLKEIEPLSIEQITVDSNIKPEIVTNFEPPAAEIIKVDTTITEEDIADAVEKDKQEGDQDQYVAPKITETFGSPRFMDFIRNVGAQLVSTGQIGEGLATGAAKAAEERAARELLEEQEKRKFEDAKRLLKIEAGLEPEETMETEDILKLSNDLETLYTDFEGGLAATGFTDYAIEIIEEAKLNNEPVGGAAGFLRKLVDKGFAFAGMGGDFDSLAADSKVEALTKVVKQKNLQAILGESGRTISDKDRVIIEKVFGTLDAFTNVDAVLGTLKESRRGLAQNNLARKNKIIASADVLKDQGTYGTKFYNSQLPSLKRLLDLDPLASQSAIARAQFGGTGYDPNIKEITLSTTT